MLAGTGENLQTDPSAKADRVGCWRTIGRQMYGLRPQGKESGAGRLRCGPLKRAAGGHSIVYFRAEQIGLADEFGGVAGYGMRVDFTGRCNLFKAAVLQE